jgi:hypothetical protein
VKEGRDEDNAVRRDNRVVRYDMGVNERRRVLRRLARCGRNGEHDTRLGPAHTKCTHMMPA